MGSWVWQNKEWLFSGAGITVLVIVWWLVRRLFARGKPSMGLVPGSSSASNVAAAQGVNISVSPNVSPVISPIMSPTESKAQARAESTPPNAPATPDIRAVNFKAIFAQALAGGKSCFVVSFRNDGLGDATKVMANIGYAGSSGQRMLVDYGRWIETEYAVPASLVGKIDWERMGGMHPQPTIDIPRGHTKNLIVALTDDGKNFAVTDMAPATNYTDFCLQTVGEIRPGEWRMIIALSADNYRSEHTFVVTVGTDGSMLPVPYEEVKAPEKGQDGGILPNVGSLRPELATIVLDEDSDVWSKGNGEGFPAVLLPFSNDPQPRKKTLAVRCLKARLTYYQPDRVEEFRRIDSGCWLSEAYNSVYLGVGDIVYLIAAVQIKGQTYAVANPRHSSARYSEDHTSGDHLPAGIYELKVGLTSGDYGEFAQSYCFRLEVGDQLKAVRLDPRTPGES
jgi:hypothetical protein